MKAYKDYFDGLPDSSSKQIELDLLKETCHIFDEPLSWIPPVIDFNENIIELPNTPFSFDSNKIIATLVTEETKENDQSNCDDSIHFDKSECEQQQKLSQTHSDAKRKRGRPKRDASEGWPKRPLSAYNIFFQQERKRLNKMIQREQNNKERLSFVELAKKIALNWKKLSHADKAPFEDLAKVNRVRYRKEVDSMMQKKQKITHSDCATSATDYTLPVHANVDKFSLKRGRGRPKRDPQEGWPKRPLSAYNCFFKHERLRLLKSRKFEPVDIDSENKCTDKGKKNDNKEKKRPSKLFVDLARTVAIKWKEITEEEKSSYKLQAEENLIAYKREMKDFLLRRSK